MKSVHDQQLASTFSKLLKRLGDAVTQVLDVGDADVSGLHLVRPKRQKATDSQAGGSSRGHASAHTGSLASGAEADADDTADDFVASMIPVVAFGPLPVKPPNNSSGNEWLPSTVQAYFASTGARERQTSCTRSAAGLIRRALFMSAVTASLASLQPMALGRRKNTR